MHLEILLPIIVVSTLFLLPASSDGYSILALMALGTKSHFTVLRPLLEELVTRGHNITLLSICPSNLQGIEEFVLDDIIDSSSFHNPFEENNSNKFTMFWKYRTLFADTIRSIFDSKAFTKFSKRITGRHFDVVILSANVNDFLLPIASNFSAPIVLISPPLLAPQLAWEFNVPTPHSYVPSIMGMTQPPFTLYERFLNALNDYILTAYMWYITTPAMEQVAKEYFPDIPPMQEMRRNISLLLVNQQVPLQNARPQMPNVIDIGGIHCKTANPLPKEFADFVSASKDGFVVFSLGSAVDGSKMPKFILEALLEGFGRLKQRVIWKIEGITESIPENVLISKWLPQQDLLGHPYCRLAILHGGLMSLQEAIYHGVPVLGFPLGLDRDNNLAKAVQTGFAKTLNWRTLTADIFFETISQMISNDSYRLQAQKYSALSRDTMRSPRETAAFWVEYVARRKGAHHLKSVTENLNLIQYLLLDIIAVLFIFILFCIMLTYAVFKTCYNWSQASTRKFSKGIKLKHT